MFEATVFPTRLLWPWTSTFPEATRDVVVFVNSTVFAVALPRLTTWAKLETGPMDTFAMPVMRPVASTVIWDTVVALP